MCQPSRGVDPAAACGESLAAAGLPVTLNHNDMHDNNVFAGAGAGDELRFFDFGDAVLSEPLGMLRIPLDALGGEDARHSVPWRRAVDQALEVWSDLVPPVQIRRLLPAALHLARLGRVESWWRCIGSFDDSELADFGGAPAQWLASLLDDDPGDQPGRRR